MKPSRLKRRGVKLQKPQARGVSESHMRVAIAESREARRDAVRRASAIWNPNAPIRMTQSNPPTERERMSNRVPRTFAGKPKSLPDSTWGAQIETDETPQTGDYVRITSKAGKTWDMRIGHVFKPGKFGTQVVTERLAPGEVAPPIDEAKAKEALVDAGFVPEEEPPF